MVREMFFFQSAASLDTVMEVVRARSLSHKSVEVNQSFKPLGAPGLESRFTGGCCHRVRVRKQWGIPKVIRKYQGFLEFHRVN